MKAIVEVILPEGDKMKGEVEVTAPVGRLKEEIMAAFLSGKDAEDYDLVLLPKDNRSSFYNYTLKNNDILLLIPKNKTSGKLFRALPSDQS